MSRALRAWASTLALAGFAIAVTARRHAPPVSRVAHLTQVSTRWMREALAVLDESTAVLDPTKCSSAYRARDELRELEAAFVPLHEELIAALKDTDALEQEEATAAALAETEADTREAQALMTKRAERMRTFHDDCPDDVEAFNQPFQQFQKQYIDGVDAFRKKRVLTVEPGRIDCLRFAVPPGFEARRLEEPKTDGWRLVSPEPDPSDPSLPQEFRAWAVLSKLGTTRDQVTAKFEATWEKKRLEWNERLTDAGRPADAPVTHRSVSFDGGVDGVLYESSSSVGFAGAWRMQRRWLVVMHRSTLYTLATSYTGPADGGDPLDAASQALLDSVRFDCAR